MNKFERQFSVEKNEVVKGCVPNDSICIDFVNIKVFMRRIHCIFRIEVSLERLREESDWKLIFRCIYNILFIGDLKQIWQNINIY